MVTTWAAVLTPEVFPTISADCAKWHLNVDYDQLDADFSDAEFYNIDQIYVVLSFDSERPDVAGCYTAHWDVDFKSTWRFTGQTHGIWKRIELIQK